MRLPSKNLELCRQVLDSGADGIIIPNIKSSFELKKNCRFEFITTQGKKRCWFFKIEQFWKEF